MDTRLVLGVLLVGACNASLGTTIDGGIVPDGHADGRQIDAPPDALVLGAWGSPQLIPGASSATLQEDDCTLNSAQTELYFAIPDATITGSPKDLWLMTRATAANAWGAPALLAGGFNTTVTEEGPRLSPDDKKLYFGRNGDIYVSTRTAVGQPWTAPVALPVAINTTFYEKWFAVCQGDYFLVSRSGGNGGTTGQDLYQGQLGVDGGTLVPELNSTSNEISTFLSADCLTVTFASNRAAGVQLYTAMRTSVTSAWTNLTTFDVGPTSTDNEDGWISGDQRTLVFASIRAPGTTKDLYISTR